VPAFSELPAFLGANVFTYTGICKWTDPDGDLSYKIFTYDVGLPEEQRSCKQLIIVIVTVVVFILIIIVMIVAVIIIIIIVVIVIIIIIIIIVIVVIVVIIIIIIISSSSILRMPTMRSQADNGDLHSPCFSILHVVLQ
jgi:hypothetical protein